MQPKVNTPAQKPVITNIVAYKSPNYNLVQNKEPTTHVPVRESSMNRCEMEKTQKLKQYSKELKTRTTKERLNSIPLTNITNRDESCNKNTFVNNVLKSKEKYLSESVKKVEDLRNQLKTKDNKIRILREENDFLIGKVEDMKGVIEQAEAKCQQMEIELNEVKDMNTKWQQSAINKCEIITKMFTDMNNVLKSKDQEELRVPIGQEYSGNIHLGRGVWLAKDTYQLASYNLKYTTRRKFVRNILVSIFGYDLLACSTISGKKSNRANKEQGKPEALSPAKILAVKDIYRYFLTNNLKMDAQQAEIEADQTNRCITKKIAQIKEVYDKPAKEGRKLLGARKSNDDDTTGSERNTESPKSNNAENEGYSGSQQHFNDIEYDLQSKDSFNGGFEHEKSQESQGFGETDDSEEEYCPEPEDIRKPQSSQESYYSSEPEYSPELDNSFEASDSPDEQDTTCIKDSAVLKNPLHFRNSDFSKNNKIEGRTMQTINYSDY